jgi:HNH endonuclease/AP2 domain
MKTIALSNGGETRVSDEDFEGLNQYSWHRSQHSNKVYVARWDNEEKRKVLMHRQIMGFPPCFVDHRNGNTLDNQQDNLRCATPRLNALNRRGVKGVYRRPSGNWRAIVQVNGKQKYLGDFATYEDAKRVRDAEHEWQMLQETV